MLESGAYAIRKVRKEMMPQLLRRSILLVFLSVLFFASARAQWRPLNPVTAAKEETDGATFTMQAGILRVRVCSNAIIRVTYATGTSLPDTPQYVVTKNEWPRTSFTMQSTENEIVLATSLLKVTVNRKNGAILFTDLANKKLFQDDDRSLTPVEVNGEKTFHSELFANLWDSTEAFYGLGQHQAGVWNYHGESIELSQDNTNISVPMFLSSKGYGIFWNNPSRSRFNNRFPHALYLSSEVADTVDY
jgi:alpha-D-xyloside xylohydrolase